MPITIRDVAREAGVSTSTVSKVLNHWSTISSETVDRVEAAIAKLHYTPNARAVSFARQTTQNIVFLTSLQRDEAYQNPHMFDIMCGVNHELHTNGYSMTLVDTYAESDPGHAVEHVIAQKCADGMIIHGSAITPDIAALLTRTQYPHMIIGKPSFESQLCWIDTNHVLAGRFAAEHMLSCGYTDVAFIGGRETDAISIQRQKGFLSAMCDYGYQNVMSLIRYTDSGKKQSYEAALSLLTAKKRPRAIICENNMIALGVMKAIDEVHLKLPDQIALLTFDSYPYSKIIDPLPTVIDINVYDMGVQAGQMMLRKLANPSLQIQSYTTLPVLNQGTTTKPESEASVLHRSDSYF